MTRRAWMGIGISALLLGVTLPSTPTAHGATAQRSLTKLQTSLPVGVRVPALGINASVVRLGLRSDNTLQVPTNASQAGWFTGSPRPGMQGPAVIVGHVHWNGQWGVFANLSKLQYGNRILVRRANGTDAEFKVTRVSRFKKSQFPSELVYGNVDSAQLRLVTCDGYDAQGRVYRDNLVVFAMLVE